MGERTDSIPTASGVAPGAMPRLRRLQSQCIIFALVSLTLPKMSFAFDTGAALSSTATKYINLDKGGVLDWRLFGSIEGIVGFGSFQALSVERAPANDNVIVDMGNSFLLGATGSAGYGPLGLGLRIDEVWKRGQRDLKEDSSIANRASRSTVGLNLSLPIVVGNEALWVEPRVGYAWVRDELKIIAKGATLVNERYEGDGVSVGATASVKLWHWVRGIWDAEYFGYSIPERRFGFQIELNSDATFTKAELRERPRPAYPGRGLVRLGLNVRFQGDGRRTLLLLLSAGFLGATKGSM